MTDSWGSLEGGTAGRGVLQRWIAVMLTAIAFLALLVVGGRVAFTGQPTGTAAQPRLAADAAILKVVRPTGRTEVRGASTPVAGTHNRAVERIGSMAMPADASLVRIASAVSRGVLAPANGSAAAHVTAGKASLLGGRIEVLDIDMRSKAAVGRSGAGGSMGGPASVGEVRVDGKPVPTEPNTQVIVEGVGTLTVNEQALVAPSRVGDAHSGPRWRGTGAAVHLRLTRPTAGLPAGSEILVGAVDASVRQPPAHSTEADTGRPGGDAPTSSGPSIPEPGAAYGGLVAGSPRPGEAGMPRRATGVRAVAPRPTGSLEGYTFPILGEATYGNDFLGARTTGIHHATDIFAAMGTPVVAVADGVLDRVGWNSLGGHRLWVHDGWGNSFYYAHLSAFSPIAMDGAFVRAGDVLGFVGDTGNAKGTPPHLHFEIHDAHGRVRNPYLFLGRWHQGRPGLAAVTGGVLGPAAASLIAARDISAVNDAVTNNAVGDLPDADAPGSAQLDGNVLHR